MSTISIQEAKKVIEDYPDHESFITENFSMWLGGHNEHYDNSIDLNNYWYECKEIVESCRVQ